MGSQLIEKDKSYPVIPSTQKGHPNKHITSVYSKLGRGKQKQISQLLYHGMESEILANPKQVKQLIVDEFFQFWRDWARVMTIFDNWGSYAETFKLLRAVLSRESLSGAICLYSLSKAVAARDCSSGLSLSSLFRPLESCPMAEEHCIMGGKGYPVRNLLLQNKDKKKKRQHRQLELKINNPPRNYLREKLDENFQV